MRMLRSALFAGVTILLAACGVPDAAAVRSDFRSLNPSAAIADVVVGEGDADNAYFYITYRLPPDTALLEQVWLYQRQATGVWSLSSRDSSGAQRQ